MKLQLVTSNEIQATSSSVPAKVAQAALKEQQTTPKKRRGRAQLTLTRTGRCGEDELPSDTGHLIGCLEYGDLKVFFDDGHRLGMAAYVLNIGTVDVHLPSLPDQELKVYAHRHALPREVYELDEHGSKQKRKRYVEYLFVLRFLSGLNGCTTSATANKGFVDWWERDVLPPAVSMVPEHLRINTTLARGIYDDRGDVQPKSRRSTSTFDIEAAVNGTPSLLTDIDLSHVVLPRAGLSANVANSDPAVLTGQAEVGFRRLIATFGFRRLPTTYGEVHGLLDYCEALELASGNGNLPDEWLESWQKAARETYCVRQPSMVPAFELYCAGNIDALRALHDREDTLTKLGVNYDPLAEE